MKKAVGLAVAACGLLACTAAGPPFESRSETATPPFDWRLPPGFPHPAVPAANPMTAAKVELGRYLFYDTRLSGNGTTACASCHRQELAFTDGRPRALGATGALHPRGAMSLTNVAYNASLAWDDPNLSSLEDQARVPMFNRRPVELGVAGDGTALIGRLGKVRRYEAMFSAVFPVRRIRLETVTAALAAFERTLISGRSAYDRRVYLDDRSAMSDSATRGMRLFFSAQAGCFKCHSGFNFSGNATHLGAPRRELEFHNTGLYNLGRKGLYPRDNPGLARHTSRVRHDGRFRAPTLRNVALTAPYMHDGSIATLAEVIDHYAAGGRTLTSGPYAGVGRDNPRKSHLVTGFELAPGERQDLVEFLESLTDQSFVEDPRFGNPFGEATEPTKVAPTGRNATSTAPMVTASVGLTP